MRVLVITLFLGLCLAGCKTTYGTDSQIQWPAQFPDGR